MLIRVLQPDLPLRALGLAYLVKFLESSSSPCVTPSTL